MVAVMDCTFFGRTSGYLVVRDPHRRENVYWSEIETETIKEYQCARDTLESLGFAFQAVVADGKPGIKGVCEGLPFQMCHFHQQQIMTKYLTKRPRLTAGKELRQMAFMLGDICEKCFELKLSTWHEKWHDFLKERTTNTETGKWHYTHRRLRSAHRSLKTNSPYLFTYKRYPELDIPNTTNSLDGWFSHLKELVQIHRGIKADIKHKIINSLLQNRP